MIMCRLIPANCCQSLANDARSDENLCIRLVHCDITTLKTFSHELAQAGLD